MSRHVLTHLPLLLLVLPAGCEGERPAGAAVALTAGPLADGELVVGTPHRGRAPVSASSGAMPASRDSREVECDGVDQDNDGSDLCNPDHDGDGVRPPLDCDDTNRLVSPREIEVPCDGIDQNCDGLDDCDSDGDGVLDRDDCDSTRPSVGLECHRRAGAEPVWVH